MENIRYTSRVNHPEVQSVARDSIETTKRITLPYYSKYEYTTLVGVRAQQLADGSKPLISLEGVQTSHPQFVWKVAEREIAERVLPFIIHRRLPDGVSEYWSASELGVVW
jgi:DNA-directed RNA polymerase I, II, and III subunit RPABC2